MSDPQRPYPAVLNSRTIERWRGIVQRAAMQGADISALVQQFAEQAFNNRVASLDSEGARRRTLFGMRQMVQREIERAQAARIKVDARTGKLHRAFEGFRVEQAEAVDKLNAARMGRLANRAPLSMTGDAGHGRQVAIAQKMEQQHQLDEHIEGLLAQAKTLDLEMQKVDIVLNKGLSNRQAVIDELAATSRELYRIAQDVVAELAQSGQAPKIALTSVAMTGAPGAQPLSDEATKTFVGEPETFSVPPVADHQPPVAQSADAWLNAKDKARQAAGKLNQAVSPWLTKVNALFGPKKDRDGGG